MRLVFCLPGKTFSANYFNSWNATIAELAKNNIAYAYSINYDPVVYYCRNRILGGQNTAGRTQKPWQSQIEYDKMIWIDSDIVWTATDIMTLISHDADIVSGVYPMEDRSHYPVVENLDYSRLSETGTFEFMDTATMATRTVPFKASYTGFGFVAIKKGVIEAMEYPWFQPKWVSNDSFHDFCSEDVGFCWTASELGFDILVDPTIKVGHEKSVVLS